MGDEAAKKFVRLPDDCLHPDRLRESDLEFLYELMKDSQPTRIVAVDADRDIMSVLESCIQKLSLNCQVEQCVFSSLPAFLDSAESGIDFLLLNSICNMPVDLLNFILVLPYLKPEAVVVLQDAVLQDPANGVSFAYSILFQNVTASKFAHNREHYPDFRVQMKLCRYNFVSPQYSSVYRNAVQQFHMLSAFRINEKTSKYIGDIFAALRIRWPYMLDGEYLKACEDVIDKHYELEHVQIYRQAVKEAERFFDAYPDMFEYLANSLFHSFQYILLYGKGKRGRALRDIFKKAGIDISGFVVSDGRTAYSNEIPVYPFSQIPFEKDKVIIVQSAASTEIETLLRQSGYHWLELPEIFWRRRCL